MNDSLKKPNIILFITHDTGNYFSCYGGPVKTPNIDNLAEKGVKFTQNYSTAPQCSPSRGSMITGKMPHSNGLMGLVNLGWNLPEDNETIPKILGRNGYSTHLIGLQHEHRYAKKIGYDTVSPRYDAPYFGRSVQKRASNLLDDVEKGEIKQPFYCSVGFFETHRPFVSGMTMRTDWKYIEIPEYLPDTKGVRKEISHFEGSVKEFDKRIGQILDHLSEKPFAGNTIVIFTVDHGIPFPRAKGTLHDPGCHTALIAYMPRKIAGGKTYDCLISGMDLFPTILNLAGVKLTTELKKEIQGKSFYNLLMEKQYDPRDHVYMELTFHDQGYNAMRGIRTEKWKYIKNFASLDNQFQIPVDFINQSSGKDYREAHPDYKKPRPDEELYNLEDDPSEIHNIAEDPQYKAVIEDLRGRLMKFLKETNDPILEKEPTEPKHPGFIIY
ncbi:MAG: sulfatase-like hydrolase/transferase [Candidatus Lokiarchaeota archaeon]|nr:sulfatase-like hydrolase/transferase [Candidatus Lokiarchaeota archaeon]